MKNPKKINISAHHFGVFCCCCCCCLCLYHFAGTGRLPLGTAPFVVFMYVKSRFIVLNWKDSDVLYYSEVSKYRRSLLKINEQVHLC